MNRPSASRLRVAVQPLRARFQTVIQKLRVRPDDRVRQCRHKPFEEGVPAALSPSPLSGSRGCRSCPDQAGLSPSRFPWVRCAGYDRRVPGPAPPVVDGLQIDQALSFQRRFGRFQRVAWSLLALIPVAAIAGLFGDGLFSDVTAGSDRVGGTVTYERFGRLTADTELVLEFARPSRTTDVAISRAFFDRYVTSEVRPEPVRVRTLADAVVFAFRRCAVRPGDLVPDTRAGRVEPRDGHGHRRHAGDPQATGLSMTGA